MHAYAYACSSVHMGVMRYADMAPSTPLSGAQVLLVYSADERLQRTMLHLLEQDAEKRLIDHRIVSAYTLNPTSYFCNHWEEAEPLRKASC